MRAAAIALASGLAVWASGCALDFSRFTRVGAERDTGLERDDGVPSTDEGGRDATGGTMVGPRPCAAPAVYAAVEQLDDATRPGRIMRVSLAGPTPVRCDDLTGQNRLAANLRSVAVLATGEVLVGSIDRVQAVYDATDRVVGDYDFSALGFGLEARDVFALDPSSGFVAGAAIYNRSTTSDHVGVLSRIVRFSEPSLAGESAHDPTRSSSPLYNKRVYAVAADPSDAGRLWVSRNTSDPSTIGSVSSVSLSASDERRVLTAFAGTARSGFSWGLTRDATEWRFVFVTNPGDATRSGVLTARARVAYGSASYTSSLLRCEPGLCADDEYIHAVPDPSSDDALIAVCGAGVERSIVRIDLNAVRTGGPVCTPLVDAPTSESGRLRLWGLAAVRGS